MFHFYRVIVYTCYLDDEKKQVLQLYGQRCDEVVRSTDSVLVSLPDFLENPAMCVTGQYKLGFLSPCIKYVCCIQY